MLRQRIQTAVIAVVVLLTVVFVLPPTATLLVLAILILAAAWEWTAFLGVEQRAARVGYVAAIGIVLAAAWLSVPALLSIELLLALGGLVWLIALAVLPRYPVAIPRALAWIAGPAILVPTFVALGQLYLAGPDGPERLLYVLVIVWAADIGAYFVGGRFGRIKLAPRVSPGKTWEGVVGGLAAVAALSFVGAWLLAAPAYIWVPLSLAAAAVSVIGDLTISMFKREAGIKDSGTLFPGHGGVLDRIDSITAAAPLFVLVLALMGMLD